MAGEEEGKTRGSGGEEEERRRIYGERGNKKRL
jgi:hypothetical protein